MKSLLLTRSSAQIWPLKALVERQNHRALVLWVIDCAPRILRVFEKSYPLDKRPSLALKAAKLWSQGKIKMPEARRAALDSHKAATSVKGENPAACAAARAMGHVVGTVHADTHALGIVFYGVTARVYASKEKNKSKVIERELTWFYKRLEYWEKKEKEVKGPWALFLLQNKLNKETLR